MSDGKIVFEKNKVFNADCFDLIAVMPDESLDLVIVDPPYGDDIGYGRNGKEILNNEDESINYRFLDAVLPKMKQDTSLYLFSNHKFVNQIKEYAVNNGYNYRMLCIMVKNNIGMGYGFRNQYEVCLVLEKGKAKYNRKDMSNVWKMKHVQHTETSHPHQKEYDIIRKIILHSSNEGDLVFAEEGNWGLIFAIRTGSADYSHKVLANGWVKRGYKSEGGYLMQNGKTYEVREEKDLFDRIGVAYVEPKHRTI